MRRRAGLAGRLIHALAAALIASPVVHAQDAASFERPAMHHHMIIATEPLVAEAGRTVLRAGGSAVDAAIAAQMVLTLVEPQTSGIGGGAFLMYYEAASGIVTSWDGRETAPAAAGPDLLRDAEGHPMDLATAGIGGRAVGAPGVVRMLEAAHRRFGKLPWQRLFDDAIRLAEAGAQVPRRLAAAIAADAGNLRRQPSAKALYLARDGTALPAGAPLVDAALAETLRAIAAGGANALLMGPVAADIAKAVRGDANPGLLTVDDLASYAPRERSPVCAAYRGHRICGVGPPSAGGVAILESLGVLGAFDMRALAAEPGATSDMPWSADAAHVLIEARRLAQADARVYLADGDQVPVPLRGLLAPRYLERRARLIDRDHAIPAVAAGEPDWDAARPPHLAPSPPRPAHDTTAIVVIDDDGNAVSMTSTVGDRFGARIVVRGFVLNDALVDFSAVPERNDRPIANRVAPGKRPRSAMSPIFVLAADGHLEYVLAGVGGAGAVSSATQVIVDLIDFMSTPEQTLAAPHIATTAAGVLIEHGPATTALADALHARGHDVRAAPVDGGTMVLAVTPDGLVGAADPRGDGVVLGD